MADSIHCCCAGLTISKHSTGSPKPLNTSDAMGRTGRIVLMFFATTLHTITSAVPLNLFFNGAQGDNGAAISAAWLADAH